MDFNNQRSPKISDSKAYRQWETIMNNSGWFQTKQQNIGFEMDNVSKVDGACTIDELENRDISKLPEQTCINVVNTETRKCKAYEQWETIMNNSGWFENKQQNSGFEMDNVSKVDGACTIDELENRDISKLPEEACKSNICYEINTEKKNLTQCR